MSDTNNIKTITTHNIYKLSHKIAEKLFILLKKFSKVDDYLLKLIGDKNNDQIIIDYMKQNSSLIENIPFNIKLKSAEKRAKKILSHINSCYLNKQNNMQLSKIENYLDIGCFDGIKTVAIGKELQLHKNNINGIDVDNYAGMPIKPINGFNFYKYDTDLKKDNSNILPFESNSFDFITILQVLHHVKNPVKMLKEIKRILKPNGLLFIREHDRNDQYIDKLIRLEHLLYSQISDKIPYDIYLKNNYEKYFSKQKLEYRLKKLGFKLLLKSNTLNTKETQYNQKKSFLNTSKNLTENMTTNPTNYYEILLQLN